MSSFLFAVVQPRSQAWAKADLARARPELRFAYARPGLLTWKSERPIDPAAPIETPFARVWGRGIGSAGAIDDVLAIAAGEGARRLHVFARDAREGDGPREEDVARAAAIEAELRSRGSFAEVARAEDGDRVLDVIVGDDDPIYVGVHVHGPGRVGDPGGRIAIEVPGDAPSRAYRKVEEMIAWARVPVREGDVAIEIGAAPGGAAYALARRGVRVIAIDPAPIDAAVLAYRGPAGAQVIHVPVAAGGLRREDLPAEARWLLSDVNLAPPVMLRYVERIAPRLPRLEGMILTMKINDARIASEIPRLLDRVRAIAPDVRAIQLGAHRREIGVVAMRGAAVRGPAGASGAGDRGGRAPRGGGRARAPRTR